MVDSDPGRAAALLRKLAVDLAKAEAREELEALHAALPDLEPELAHRRRGAIMRKIRRLAPGRAAAVAALEDIDGTVQTSPDAVARILRRHWGDVFSARHLCPNNVTNWLQEDLGAVDGLSTALKPLLSDYQLWRVRQDDISSAISCTSTSAPGPDGIPYVAWRRLGSLGCDVLFEAAQVLEAEDGRRHLEDACPLDENGQSDFNAATMVFLPKKDPLISESGVAYTTAGDLRPLSIVNTDNRLLANALRLRIEPLLAQAISSLQQGFLPGRSLLKNVLDTDSAMRECAFRAPSSAAIFFDFRLHSYQFPTAFCSVHWSLLVSQRRSAALSLVCITGMGASW